MVLMIPDTLSFPGWTHAYTPKELILTLTVSCVFATLFIKATTIGALMKKLKLSTFTPLEEINYREMLIYVYDATLKKLKESHDKGYINNETFALVLEEQQSRIKETLTELKDKSNDPALLEKVIRLHAIGIERKYVKGLFAFNEVSEVIIKRIMAKLEYQTHAIEHDTHHEGSYEHGHSQDVFEYLASIVHKIFGKASTPEERAADSYLYYRALSIISRKVVKELNRLDSCFATDFTLPHSAIQKTIAVYDTYRDGSQRKMEELKKEYPVQLALLDAQLASRALYKNESVLLTNLREREMVTPKVSIALADRFATEST
jgi:CPA1 family monovalent cation:H+ antiporter